MKLTLISVVLFTTLFFTSLSSQAEVYRWVDNEGKVRIGIQPPAQENMDDNDSEDISEPMPTVVKREAPVNKPAATNPIQFMAPEVKSVSPVIAAPAMVPAPVKAPKTVKKPIIMKKKMPVKKTVVKKAPAKKPAVPKSVAKKKPKKVTKPKKITQSKKTTPATKKTAAINEDVLRKAEMCGVFSDYVSQYKEKVNDCSVNLCDIYKRSLARYEKKQKSYCG